ncbi:unnamed protein product [Ceratitis capitata]|uniref:(Mediterranean fruit fly) hypothetical protein n=1 Tax=Ceratitis capitata TaxID=7213 RepID=A0A811UWH2_CERCA|nr:unnamed protein product [Ceratitis capitata]
MQSTQREVYENAQKEKDERRESEKKKCFDDWREFYLQLFGSVKRKSDLRTYSENETGDIYMPEGWNHFPKYAIRYIYNRMLHILVAVEMEHRLLINFLNTRTNIVTNITIFPDMTVRSTCGGDIHMLIPFPEKLAQTLYCNLIQTFTDMRACDRPPKIMSRTKQHSNPWDGLTERRTTDVYSILEEDNVTKVDRSQDIQTFGNENTRFDESNTPGTRRASWADMKPQTANAEIMKPLKSRLDETAEPVKEAIVSYVEAMVNNWFRLYGTEIMKSGKTAIQDLAEQRIMIERYMNFVKPVSEPKKGFVIYNSRVTLDDSKHTIFGESAKRETKGLQNGSDARTELAKSLTETAQPTSKMVSKPGTDVDFRCHGGVEANKAEDKNKLKINRNNYQHVRPKVSSGIRKERITQKPVVQSGKKSAESVAPASQINTNFKDKHIQSKVFTGKEASKPVLKKKKSKPKLISSSFGELLLEKEIKKAYEISKLNTDNRIPSSSRKKWGSSTNSTTQNSSTNNEGKSKHKRSKLKTNTPSSKSPKHNASKQSGKSSIDVAESSPLKKIRFSLPTNLNTNWPSIYKNLETLLKTSFPFREQAREGGGDKSPKDTNSSSSLLQTIEEHFAKQIEAKRLELLEQVRRRKLHGIMETQEEIEVKNKFSIIEDESKEKDVGYFVQPADEWSQWEFKKRLREIQERDLMTTLNNKTPNYVE